MAASALQSFCKNWLNRPAPELIVSFAQELSTQHHGTAIVLAYGSSLRGVSLQETLIDFYLLTDDFSGVSSNLFSRFGCALVPPNVYYAETEINGQKLRAKYAVLPLQQFARKMQANVRNPYFWARFAQPTICVFKRDHDTEEALHKACAAALATCYGNAKAASPATEPLSIWADGFTATYATEFRSESTARASHIVESHADYYITAAGLLLDVAPIHTNHFLRRLNGKLLSLARLAKAAFTFQGGADYIAWKIERHSGQKITVTDWQRRHPLLAGLLLLPSLLRKGAIR